MGQVIELHCGLPIALPVASAQDVDYVLGGEALSIRKVILRQHGGLTVGGNGLHGLHRERLNGAKIQEVLRRLRKGAGAEYCQENRD
jgi:hypothetical protein